MPVSGRLADMTAKGSSLRKPVSRRLSAHRRSLPGLSLASTGEFTFLAVGLPAALRVGTPMGFPCSAWLRFDRGGCFLLRRDGGVRTAGTASPTVTCRFSTANPVLRSRIPSPEGADNGAYGNSLHVHPSGLPQPVAPGSRAGMCQIQDGACPGRRPAGQGRRSGRGGGSWRPGRRRCSPPRAHGRSVG